MKQTLSKLFFLIFPERDDARVVRMLSQGELATLYKPCRSDNIYGLLPFSDHRVRACIHESKFHENERALYLLGSILKQHLVTQEATIVIPIPLTHKRTKKRGYNQVTRIIKASKTGLTLAENVLYKHTDTKPQTRLNRKERLTNVAGAFAVFETPLNKKRIAGAHVLILDDVTTTGATLQAAKAALSPLRPASVTCLALAH